MTVGPILRPGARLEVTLELADSKGARIEADSRAETELGDIHGRFCLRLDGGVLFDGREAGVYHLIETATALLFLVRDLELGPCPSIDGDHGDVYRSTERLPTSLARHGADGAVFLIVRVEQGNVLRFHRQRNRIFIRPIGEDPRLPASEPFVKSTVLVDAIREGYRELLAQLDALGESADHVTDGGTLEALLVDLDHIATTLVPEG